MSSEYDSEEPGSDEYDTRMQLGGRRTKNNSLIDLTDLMPGEGSKLDGITGLNSSMFANAKNKLGGKILSEAEISELNLEKELLRCPPGYDPVKWSVLTRKQKLKEVGISEKEWNRLVRE